MGRISKPSAPSLSPLSPLALEGAAARWMVTLHNVDAIELQNFNHFMMTLHRCFKDPLADRKARNHIKNHEAEPLTCGRDLACRVDWPEDILVSWFKDG